LGLRAVQVGRQNIPVLFTPAKNIPSNDSSLFNSALYISVLLGKLFIEFFQPVDLFLHLFEYFRLNIKPSLSSAATHGNRLIIT
jgi:hypothetical protein